MGDGNTESWEMIERWKAEHPELSGGGPIRPAGRPRLAPVPDPPPQASRGQQRDMIDRWRLEHPELTSFGPPQPTVVAPVAPPRFESDRRVIELDSTPLTVLGAFIIGCILGGIAMTIITGIAFWGFSG